MISCQKKKKKIKKERKKNKKNILRAYQRILRKKNKKYIKLKVDNITKFYKKRKYER